MRQLALALALPRPEVRIVPLPPLGPHWALSGRRCPSAGGWRIPYAPAVLLAEWRSPEGGRVSMPCEPREGCEDCAACREHRCTL